MTTCIITKEGNQFNIKLVNKKDGYSEVFVVSEVVVSDEAYISLGNNVSLFATLVTGVNNGIVYPLPSGNE